jgi:hypothetical protein
MNTNCVSVPLGPEKLTSYPLTITAFVRKDRKAPTKVDVDLSTVKPLIILCERLLAMGDCEEAYLGIPNSALCAWAYFQYRSEVPISELATLLLKASARALLAEMEETHGILELILRLLPAEAS